MSARLHGPFRFDRLVVGAANRLAVTAARTVAESPGSVYNPLFVYAEPGLGKTHLLVAIGHRALEINPGIRVEYLTLDEFLEAFHTALASGQGDAYRRHVAEADLLLLDDVQFLAHQREMQAELIRVLDLMQTDERQIVLASDRPPAEIEALDDRLIRRFAGGLVVDIARPDFETRVAILQRKAQELEAGIGPEVIAEVARHEYGNVRELLGALNRLVALQAVSDGPIGPAEAVTFLRGAEADAAPPMSDADDVPETEAPAAKAPAAAPAAESETTGGDEFGSFLSEVVATVADQVDAWRQRVAAAILRWEGEGYRTTRLEQLLAAEIPEDPEPVLTQFANDVSRLEALAKEAGDLSHDLGGNTVFRDPDQIKEAEALVERARTGANPPPAPSQLWRLEDLAESGGNRMALRSGATVAAEPGTRYNPLVIVGGSGRGKTHLLHGIGNALAARADAVVACLGAHDFIAELIEALERDRIQAWRSRYARATAFLLDDVHLLAGKERTQEELYLLFNRFVEAERQLVFTSGVPLAELEEVEPRLLTRLEGGLVVELPAPDREVRFEVAARLLRARLDVEDDELANYLASRPVESVRSLHGVVQRVVNAAEVKEVAPSIALARELLEGPAVQPPGRTRRMRASGVIVPTSGGVRNPEKVVWHWPVAVDRVIEEWR